MNNGMFWSTKKSAEPTARSEQGRAICTRVRIAPARTRREIVLLVDKPHRALSRWRKAAATLLFALGPCAGFVAPASAQVEEQTMISEYGTVKWVFPEGGATGAGHPDYQHFQTYYHFANTNDAGVWVKAYFQGDAPAGVNWIFLQPHSRTSLSFHDASGGRSGFNAAEFYSASPPNEIQVSSSMFNDGFGTDFWDASKAVNGATMARKTWTFGEGGVFSLLGNGQPAFDHYYAIYNPNATPITVTASYYPDTVDSGNGVIVTDAARSVAGLSRLTFDPIAGSPHDPNGLRERSAKITCSAPCVAQMTMYQRRDVGLRRTNTQSALGSKPSTKWYVLGIPTGGSWEPRLYLFNSSAQWNNVTFTYRNAAGGVLQTESFSMPPQSRGTYGVALSTLDQLPYSGNPAGPRVAVGPLGRDGSDLSLEVSASQPNSLSLTKILYWPQNGYWWNEGSSTTGHAVGGNKIVFPGGNVGGGFWNYVQVMNTSNTQGTNIWATTYWAGGGVTGKRLVGYLQPNGMLQLDATAGWYLGGQTGDFTTVIESDGPAIVGESSTYFGWASPGPEWLWRAGDAVEGIIYNGSSQPIQP